jgi:hypothetical protein
MIIGNLKIFNLNKTIFFQGSLYEKTAVLYKYRKYEFRKILNEDDYDYVVDPVLRKRLAKAFNRAGL